MPRKKVEKVKSDLEKEKNEIEEYFNLISKNFMKDINPSVLYKSNIIQSLIQRQNKLFEEIKKIDDNIKILQEITEKILTHQKVKNFIGILQETVIEKDKNKSQPLLDPENEEDTEEETDFIVNLSQDKKDKDKDKEEKIQTFANLFSNLLLLNSTTILPPTMTIAPGPSFFIPPFIKGTGSIFLHKIEEEENQKECFLEMDNDITMEFIVFFSNKLNYLKTQYFNELFAIQQKISEEINTLNLKIN